MTNTRNVLLALGLIILDQLAKAAFFFYEPLKSHLFINYTRSIWLSVAVLIAVGICYLIIAANQAKSNAASNHLNKEKNQRVLLGLTLILAGGISNLLDQLVYAGVLDIGKISTLTFNIADILVITGIVIVLLAFPPKKLS